MSGHAAVNSSMRAWVNAMLEHHLSLGLLHKGDPDAPSKMLDLHDAELRAYVTVGALTEEEADDWRERFPRAAAAVALPDREVATEQIRARANQLLEERLSALAPSLKERDRESSLRFTSALRALSAVGLITDEEHDRWDERARPKPASPPPPPPPRRSYNADHLRRIVAGPPQSLSATRVICAELYDDCVILRWHRLLSPEEAAARENFDLFQDFPKGLFEQGRRWGATFELRDDRGTHYDRVAGDSGMTHEFRRSRDQNPSPVWGAATFLPHAPPEATRLEAINGSDRFILAPARSPR